MCALARMATPAADPPGCVAALAQTTGCDCSWASPKNKAPLQGLAKAGTKAQMGCPASGADRAGCLAASASAEACEAFCCHGLDGAGPPEVTSAPAGDLKPVTGPCGQWQWRPTDLDSTGGCWVSVDPSLQKLPYNEGGNGPWVGAEGNLGPKGAWGGLFLLAFLVSLVAYLGVFGTLNWRKGIRGRQALPHHRFWSEVSALVQDGVAFSRARLRGESFSGRRQGQGAARAAVGGGGAGSRKKEKKEKKEKKGKKGKGGARGSGDYGVAPDEPSPLSTPLAPAEAPPPRAAEGTAAGDG